MLPQRRCTGNGARLHFGNRVSVRIILRADVVVWDVRPFTLNWRALSECGGRHHAESFLTHGDRLRTSIVNIAQGYPKVDRISDTTFKRYEFMRPSA
jgi:hypothetical protein